MYADVFAISANKLTVDILTRKND